MTKDEAALRTMIVDDEPLAIERMQVLCAELGQLQVVGTASDGEAALRLADKLKPDLLLLDMTMPGMDGLGGDRLQDVVDRAIARAERVASEGGEWLSEFWVPHRSELLRIDAAQVERIDAERDYVRLHVGDRSYLLLQTIAGLEGRLDPTRFIRIHRSAILRRDRIRGLRHEGLGVWSVELDNGEALRIGRTYLRKVKAMAGR